MKIALQQPFSGFNTLPDLRNTLQVSAPVFGSRQMDKVCFAGSKPTQPSHSSLLQQPLSAFKKTTQARVQSLGKAEAMAELTQLLDPILQGQSIPGVDSKKRFLLQQLRQIAGARGQGHMALAQINFTVGDLLGNARKIVNYLDAAEKIGVDLVVFPEQPLTGWPLGDLIEFYPQLVEDQLRVLEAIAAKTGKTKAMIGFIEPRYQDPNEPGQQRKFYNALAILGEGRMEGIVRKTHLPTYQEFYEGRQLEPASTVGVYPPETMRSPKIDPQLQGGLSNIYGLRYGTSICEDIWADSDLLKRNLYIRNPIQELHALGPDVLINVSASPSRAHKESQKHEMLGQTAAKWKTPLVYVNAIGGNDDLVYDGASRVYNAQGQLIARAKSFEEQFMIVNPKQGLGKIFSLSDGRQFPLSTKKLQSFHASDSQDLARTYQSVRLAILDYFNKNGYQKAVLGISGGLDSAVAATLAVDALGKNNVLGVFMPSDGITRDESRQDAEALCKNLGIPLVVMPIGGVLGAVWQILNPAFEQIQEHWGEFACNPVTNQNNQARIRSMFLRAITNQFGKVLNIGTSDKSEAIIGNGTVAGDMSSDYAVLKDITKTKLNALARWLNRHTGEGPRIPKRVITKPPTAELDKKPGSNEILTDVERYGSTFLLRDEALYHLLRGSSLEKMMAQPMKAERQEGLDPTDKQIGLERFFYHLAKNGIFKWGHLAKGPIIDEKGFTSGELQIPIVAGWNVPWGGIQEKEIRDALDIKIATIKQTFPERVTQRLRELGILNPVAS